MVFLSFFRSIGKEKLNKTNIESLMRALNHSLQIYPKLGDVFRSWFPFFLIFFKLFLFFFPV